MRYSVVLMMLTIFIQHSVGLTECETNIDNKVESISSVPDCNCKIGSVDYAVNKFISPILNNLTTQ